MPGGDSPAGATQQTFRYGSDSLVLCQFTQDYVIIGTFLAHNGDSHYEFR